jgi:hypothetical protein
MQPVDFFILLLLPPKEANKRQQEALSEAFIAVECAKKSVVHLVEMLIDHIIDLQFEQERKHQDRQSDAEPTACALIADATWKHADRDNSS